MTESTTESRTTAGANRRYLIWLLVLLPFLAVLLATAYAAVAQPACVWCHRRDAKFAASHRQGAPLQRPVCCVSRVASSRRSLRVWCS